MSSKRCEPATWPHPVEGDVELGQEVRDRRPQGPDEVGQAAALHGELVLRGRPAAVGCCAVNVTLQPGPLLPVGTRAALWSDEEKMGGVPLKRLVALRII